MVAQQAARVQSSLSDLDHLGQNSASQLNKQALNALVELRCYQKAMIELSIDGQLDPEKFAAFMLRSHEDFAAVAAEVTRESEQLRLEVDDDYHDPDNQE